MNLTSFEEKLRLYYKNESNAKQTSSISLTWYLYRYEHFMLIYKSKVKITIKDICDQTSIHSDSACVFMVPLISTRNIRFILSHSISQMQIHQIKGRKYTSELRTSYSDINYYMLSALLVVCRKSRDRQYALGNTLSGLAHWPDCYPLVN